MIRDYENAFTAGRNECPTVCLPTGNMNNTTRVSRTEMKVSRLQLRVVVIKDEVVAIKEDEAVGRGGSIKCFRCGVEGHYSNECTATDGTTNLQSANEEQEEEGGCSEQFLTHAVDVTNNNHFAVYGMVRQRAPDAQTCCSTSRGPKPHR